MKINSRKLELKGEMFMDVGHRIKALIHDKGFKQYAIASKAGIDAKLFNSMLNNRKIIKAEDIVGICKAIGCSPNEVLGYIDKSDEPKAG